MAQQTVVEVGGPFFEDLERGQVFEAPAMTLDSGHAAIHLAIAGDRLALPLDANLSREVTGSESPLIHPNLVCDVAIGQSTVPTQRVLGNLFYRGPRPAAAGVRRRHPPHPHRGGRAEAEPAALRRLGLGPGGAADPAPRTSAASRCSTSTAARCCRSATRSVATGHEDSFEAISSELDPERVRAAVPDWRYEALRARIPAESADPESRERCSRSRAATRSPRRRSWPG